MLGMGGSQGSSPSEVTSQAASFYDFLELSMKSSNLWLESDSSPSHVTWGHPAGSFWVCWSKQLLIVAAQSFHAFSLQGRSRGGTDVHSHTVKILSRAVVLNCISFIKVCLIYIYINGGAPSALPVVPCCHANSSENAPSVCWHSEFMPHTATAESPVQHTVCLLVNNGALSVPRQMQLVCLVYHVRKKKNWLPPRPSLGMPPLISALCTSADTSTLFCFILGKASADRLSRPRTDVWFFYDRWIMGVDRCLRTGVKLL